MRFWDIYSHSYDAVRFAIPYSRLLDSLVDALDTRPGTTVLDLGCGTGNLEERLALRSPDADAVGVDLSEGMLARARRRCARFPQVSFVRADVAGHLPFHDESFDRVVANNVLYSIPDRARTVAEARRVLRPGGLFVLSDPKAGARMSELVRAHFAEIAAMPPGRRIRQYSKSCLTLPLLGLAPMLMITARIASGTRTGGYRFSTASEIASLLSGFTDVSIGETYADQNWLVVAHVPGPSSSRTASSATSSDSSSPLNDITSP